MHPARYLAASIALACLLGAASASLAQQAPPVEGDEAALIAVLQSDAELFSKAKACQALAVKGTAQCVPVLAALLPDPQLSHYARFGLQPNPATEVDEGLRAALGKLEGPLLIGVINSIGMRRDAAAGEALTKLMKHDDAQIAAAATAALGRIATPPAITALTAALSETEARRPAVADACLTACDMLIADGKKAEALTLYEALRAAELPQHYTVAALHGAILAQGQEGLPMIAELLASENKALFGVALGTAQKIGGPEAAKTLIEALKTMPLQRQVLVVYALGNLGEPAALPVVLELATSGSPEVQLPAIEVLASLGDASAVPVLLAAAVDADSARAAAALASLAELPGQGVDAKLAEMLEGSQGPQQLVLIELAGLRGITPAVPQLQKLADAEDPALASAAVKALGLTIGLEQLPSLVDRLVAPKTPELGAAAKAAMNNALLRMPDRDAAAAMLIDRLAAAPPQAKAELLGLLGVVGGDKALSGLAAAAREGSDPTQDAATQALGGWMAADAAPVLLELATEGPEKYKVRTLRGYLRIARQLDVPLDDRVEMCRKAIAAAQRNDEKKLALEILARYPTAAGLKLAADQLDTPGLKEAAAEAAVAIAEKIVAAHPAAVAEAMGKAAGATGNAELSTKARNLQRRAQR